MHVTSATGEYATILDLVAMELIALLQSRDEGLFSIYSTSHIASRTDLSLYASIDALPDFYFFNTRSTWIKRTRGFEVDYGSRLSVQDNVEHIGYSDMPSSLDHQHDLELVLYKSRQIAVGLLSANKPEKVAKWLSDMRARFQGKNYTYEEMLKVAKAHQVLIDPFLTDWIWSSTVPRYLVSGADCARIADDEQGNTRFKTTFQIKNAQSIMGIVLVSYPSPQTIDQNKLVYVSYDEAILMEGNSTKQVNLVSSYELSSVRLNLGLSMNRDPLIVPTTRVERIDEQPAPFVQTSEWSPVPIGIVVDDLDRGFSIPNLRYLPQRQKPMSLFRLLQTLDSEQVVEFDQGLPRYDASYEKFYRYHWTRDVSGTRRIRGYGKFRRTWAEVLVDSRNKNPPAAKFSIEIPNATKWKLEYYAPMLAHDIYEGPFPLRFTISDESNQIVHDIRTGKWRRGWNSVGVFDLVLGNVDVEVSIAGPVTEPGDLLFADAIRWTKADRGDLVQ